MKWRQMMNHDGQVLEKEIPTVAYTINFSDCKSPNKTKISRLRKQCGSVNWIIKSTWPSGLKINKIITMYSSRTWLCQHNQWIWVKDLRVTFHLFIVVVKTAVVKRNKTCDENRPTEQNNVGILFHLWKKMKVLQVRSYCKNEIYSRKIWNSRWRKNNFMQRKFPVRSPSRSSQWFSSSKFVSLENEKL